VKPLTARAQIGVVGLGTIGSEELALWRRSGHPAVGFDTSRTRVQAQELLGQGGDDASGLTSRFSDLASCDALVLCLPNLDSQGELTLKAFDQFLDKIWTLEPAERLIVVASTVPVGFTRDFANRLGEHGRLVAHVPERFDPGRSTSLGEIPRVAGATSKEALDLTVDLYSRVGVTITPVDPVEVAEASKLLENAFRLVNIAFINEFAELCRRMGITAADVIDAAATKPFAFMKHTPGVGAGCTCIPTVSQYLLDAARHNELELPILRDAVDGNAHLVDRVVAHLDQLLRANAVSRARVLVVGATYKPNYPDTRGSAALRFARELGARHKVTVYDPIVDTTRWPSDLALVREPPRPASYDAVVVAVRHRQVDLDALRQAGPIFIDLVRGSVEVDESIPTRK